MEISFADLKEKEIINIYDGKKIGRIIDVLFDIESGVVRGIVVPAEKKLFRKGEDIFIPLEKLKKIGDDVILVKLPIKGNDLRLKYQAESVLTESKYNFNNSKYYNYYDVYNKANIERENLNNRQNSINNTNKSQSQSNNKSYVRFKPINNIKYK